MIVMHCYMSCLVCLCELTQTVLELRLCRLDTHQKEEGCCGFTRQQKQQMPSHVHKHTP